MSLRAHKEDVKTDENPNASIFLWMIPILLLGNLRSIDSDNEIRHSKDKPGISN